MTRLALALLACLLASAHQPGARTPEQLIISEEMAILDLSRPITAADLATWRVGQGAPRAAMVAELCGAKTKSGRPCRNRVKGGGPCWRHR